MSEPSWIEQARKYLGVAEVNGPHHNPHILKWWDAIGAPFDDDETPWCGAFVGGVLAEVGIKPVAGGASAKAWLKLGKPGNVGRMLDRPAVGCVVVYDRPPNPASGHVGFLLGVDQHGNQMILGGNQGDKVSIKPFSTKRVAGYRWPGIAPYESRYTLPLIGSDGRVSTNEA